MASSASAYRRYPMNSPKRYSPRRAALKALPSRTSCLRQQCRSPPTQPPCHFLRTLTMTPPTEQANTAAAPQAGVEPLSGVTILDLTQHLAGPFATQILGDLGARIIKVEPPKGDGTRGIGPYFVDGDSAYYLSVNRNKESVCLDLKTDAGREAVLRLMQHVDAVVENFRPGTLKRLGIDIDEIRRRRPRLVVCSISGFGQDGKYRDNPAFDMIVQALNGGIGTLAALIQAWRSGIAPTIDVAMLDTQISLLSYVASYVLAGSPVPGRQGRQHMSIPTYRALTCADGVDLVITANTQRMWGGLCRALDLEHLENDQRFATREERRLHFAELTDIIDAACLRFSGQELLERLQANDVPSAQINNVKEALDDEHVRSRDMILELPRGEVKISTPGNPIKVSTSANTHTAPPRLGEHTYSVLTDLAGMTSAEIDRLAAAGAFGTTKADSRV